MPLGMEAATLYFVPMALRISAYAAWAMRDHWSFSYCVTVIMAVSFVLAWPVLYAMALRVAQYLIDAHLLGNGGISCGGLTHGGIVKPSFPAKPVTLRRPRMQENVGAVQHKP